jgi:hypothetical protein
MSENSKREELKKLKIIKRMEELREKGFSEEKIKRFIELDRLYEERIKGDLLLKRITKKRNKKYQLENKEVLKEKRRTKRLNEKSLSSEEKIIESLKS